MEGCEIAHAIGSWACASISASPVVRIHALHVTVVGLRAAGSRLLNSGTAVRMTGRGMHMPEMLAARHRQGTACDVYRRSHRREPPCNVAAGPADDVYRLDVDVKRLAYVAERPAQVAKRPAYVATRPAYLV